MPQAGSQPPLADVPPGKLVDLDDIRDALALWPKFEALAMMSSQSSLPPQTGMQLLPSGTAPFIQHSIALRQRLFQVQNQLQQAQQVQLAARLANLINRIQAQLAQVQNPQMASVGIAQPGTAVNAGSWFMIKDQRSARIQSIMGLAAVARQDEHEEDWFKRLRDSARTDPRRWRALVMAALALNRHALAREAIGELIRARPDDFFPRIACLCLWSHSASSFPASAVPRESPAVPESTEFLASLRWLVDRRPDLRSELTYGLVNVLISRKGDVDEAARVLSAAVATADLEALARLAGLASRVGDLSLQKTILDRAAELAASHAGSASTAPALHAILEANLLFSDDEAYIERILSLLDFCLDYGERGEPRRGSPDHEAGLAKDERERTGARLA